MSNLFILYSLSCNVACCPCKLTFFPDFSWDMIFSFKYGYSITLVTDISFLRKFKFCALVHVCSVTSIISDYATLWTVANQASLCMGFSRQEYWSGLPLLCSRDWTTRDWTHVSCIAGGFFTHWATSVQSLSRVWLCDPMVLSMSAFPVHHQLLEPTQTHVHHVGDAIQPSHPLSSPSPPAFSLSEHQDLFQWVDSSHQVAKELEFQNQSFQWIFRTDIL